MNKDIEKDLLNNFRDFLSSADDDFKRKRYNPAVSSYFKAIAIMCDLKIYQERRLLPKNHKERFLFLKMHFPDAYSIINELFEKYRDSYNIRMKQKDAVNIKKNVKKLKEIFSIE